MFNGSFIKLLELCEFSPKFTHRNMPYPLAFFVAAITVLMPFGKCGDNRVSFIESLSRVQFPEIRLSVQTQIFAST